MNSLDRAIKNRRSVYWKRIVVTALFVLWAAYIWHNSMETAALSSVRSERITKAVNDWLSSGGKILIYERSIRKAAHFAEYALEGILAVLVLWAYELPVRRHICTGLLTGLLTALIDETIQLFSIGRDSSVSDVWIDFAGFIFGLLLSILWQHVRKLCGRRRSATKEKDKNRT